MNKSAIVRKLRADIKTQELMKEQQQKSGTRVIHEFKLLPNTDLITLDKFQRLQLIKSLELYFPDLYVEVEFTKVYNIECELELDKFLNVLDEQMSTDTHFAIYKDCQTAEYDFLRQLRLRYMTK